ncbi:MAG: DUF86 domain-containing protein [Anaeroplasma sp.]|nr:DUF86 domain-containing protein [Anaeroplasma sp.]
MDNGKTYKYYVEKIIDDINFCIKHLEAISLQEFNMDEILSSAISFKFVQISENVKKLPLSINEVYPNIPWNKISGLRNRIVHDYGSIQLDIIYNTVKYDLPKLIVDLNEIIK